MSHPPQKQGWLASMSPVKRTALGIFLIAVIVVLGVVYGPHYNDTNTTTGDAPPVPATVINALSSLRVNRGFVYQGVTITVTGVEQAQSFSDDGKSAYAHVKYIVRVLLHIQASTSQQGALGIDYTTLSRLVLNDGTQVQSRLAQISPDVLPGQNENGFLDFWVQSPLNLSLLTFTLGGASIAFGQ